MDIYDSLALGLTTAMQPMNLWLCFIGVLLGTFVGVLPGIGAIATISMLLPTTFYLEPVGAVVMLAGVYYGSEYGGSIASILLHLPGSASSAVTCLDGYPMAKQGRAGVALFMTAAASFVGGLAGIFVLILFAPTLARVAFSFQSPEYFALMLFGLLAAASVSSGSPLKAVAMVLLGLLFGCIGTEVNSGMNRFTFGQLELYDGIGLVAVAMGLFGLPEVIQTLGEGTDQQPRFKVTLRSMVPKWADIRQSIGATFRGTGIGVALGVLPGTGGTIATYISYAAEKRLAKDPSRFGNGAIEGVVSPEASNNAAAQTAFVPTLALGVPGSASMAIILGALMLHGIQPGPALITNHPDIFWGLIMSFLLGNIMLLVLNIPLIGMWVRMLHIPYGVLAPIVVAFVCVGAYSADNSSFDVLLLVVFGVVGYAARQFDFPVPPLLLGFILGPLLEENLRRSLLLARGDFGMLFLRPISGTLLVLASITIAYVVFTSFRQMTQDGAVPRPAAEGS